VTASIEQLTGRGLFDGVRLRDGSLIGTRPPRPEDLHALAAGIPEVRGNPRRLARLANPHAALVAVAPGGEPIGLALLIRARDGSAVGHVVVAVVKSWRGLGVATALLSRLAELARGMGVERFALDCQASPTEARALLSQVEPAVVTDGGRGVLSVHIELPARVGYATPMSHVLRRIAAGRINAERTLDGRSIEAG
jgi:GNAT superfamily N-acetyltransferase